MSLSLAGDGTVQGFDAGASGFGGLVAVKHVLKTDTFTTSSLSAGASAAVTGLSITHSVSDAANTLIMFATFGAASSSGDDTLVGIGIYDGSAFIDIGDTDSNRTSVGAAGAVLPASGGSISTTAIHTPGSGAVTYTVHAFNVAAGARTVYVNRTKSTSDSGDNPRTASSLVIMEVAV